MSTYGFCENKCKKEVYDKEEVDNITYELKYNNTPLQVADTEALKKYLENTAPVGCYILSVESGSTNAVFVQKMSSKYLSFIIFGYSAIARQYRCYNGTWSEASLG